MLGESPSAKRAKSLVGRSSRRGPLDLYVQFVIQDAAQPVGFALSNSVEALQRRAVDVEGARVLVLGLAYKPDVGGGSASVPPLSGRGAPRGNRGQVSGGACSER